MADETLLYPLIALLVLIGLIYLCSRTGWCQQSPDLELGLPSDWGTNQVPIDFFQLVLQYGPGWCADKQCNGLQNDQKFILHGLWPSSNVEGATLKVFGAKYDENVNARRIDDLLENFTPLLNHEPHNHWRHEWNKHGKAAMAIPELNSQEKYFKKALALQKQYPIMEYLRASGITPSNSNSYSFEQIRDAIQRRVQKRVKISTKKHRDFQWPVLSEVTIYLDTDLNPINCPNLSTYRGSIYIPKAISSHYEL